MGEAIHGELRTNEVKRLQKSCFRGSGELDDLERQIGASVEAAWLSVNRATTEQGAVDVLMRRIVPIGSEWGSTRSNVELVLAYAMTLEDIVHDDRLSKSEYGG